MRIWRGICMVKTFVRAKHWLFRESAALDAQLSAAVSLWMYSMDENHFFSFFYIMILSIYRANKTCHAISFVFWNEQLDSPSPKATNASMFSGPYSFLFFKGKHENLLVIVDAQALY